MRQDFLVIAGEKSRYINFSNGHMFKWLIPSVIWMYMVQEWDEYRELEVAWLLCAPVSVLCQGGAGTDVVFHTDSAIRVAFLLTKIPILSPGQNGVMCLFWGTEQALSPPAELPDTGTSSLHPSRYQLLTGFLWLTDPAVLSQGLCLPRGLEYSAACPVFTKHGLCRLSVFHGIVSFLFQILCNYIFKNFCGSWHLFLHREEKKPQRNPVTCVLLVFL